MKSNQAVGAVNSCSRAESCGRSSQTPTTSTTGKVDASRVRDEALEELRKAAAAVLAMCDSIGEFRNGVTDPTGTIDEGAIRASELLEELRRSLIGTPKSAEGEGA